MTQYRLWQALWVVVVVMGVSAVGLTFGYIWLGEDDRMAHTAVLTGVLALGGAFFTAMWTDFCKPHKNREARLPRAERKRLRQEEARIQLEADIKRLEREAGISDAPQ